MKFVKFRNVTEKELPKKGKGVYLVKWGVQIVIFESGLFRNILEVGLLKEEATGWQAPPRFRKMVSGASVASVIVP